MSHLHELLRLRQKTFVDGEAAERLVENYEKNGVLPKLENAKKKKELLKVVKGMYCIEPRLFQGLNKEQQKISVGLLGILLEAGKKDDIVKLLEQIIPLTKEDKKLL